MPGHSPSGDRDTGAAQRERERRNTRYSPSKSALSLPAPILAETEAHQGLLGEPDITHFAHQCKERRGTSHPPSPGYGRNPGAAPRLAPTRDGLLRAEAEGVFHETSLDAAGGKAQGIADQEGVVAVVDMRGTVELEAAVEDGGVVLVLHDAGVDVGSLGQGRAIEEPADAGDRITIHREGDAPEVLGDGFMQEQDHGGDWGNRAGWVPESVPSPRPHAGPLQAAHR